MATVASEKIETRNATEGAAGVRIDRDKYDAMKKALLAVIPRRADGVAFKDLVGLVKPLLPDDVFAGASPSWYATTVKLDLEARGLIERVPGARPQRVRRPRR